MWWDCYCQPAHLYTPTGIYWFFVFSTKSKEHKSPCPQLFKKAWKKILRIIVNSIHMPPPSRIYNKVLVGKILSSTRRENMDAFYSMILIQMIKLRWRKTVKNDQNNTRDRSHKCISHLHQLGHFGYLFPLAYCIHHTLARGHSSDGNNPGALSRLFWEKRRVAPLISTKWLRLNKRAQPKAKRPSTWSECRALSVAPSTLMLSRRLRRAGFLRQGQSFQSKGLH